MEVHHPLFGEVNISMSSAIEHHLGGGGGGGGRGAITEQEDAQLTVSEAWKGKIFYGKPWNTIKIGLHLGKGVKGGCGGGT